MSQLETIFSRKSVRSYTGEKASEEELALVIKAAQAAPASVGNYDNIHLTVVENPALLSEISNAAAELFRSRGVTDPLYQAPTLIIVSTKPRGDAQGNAEFSNAAIMIENMSLAATELGLGSCLIWGAINVLRDTPELVAKLNLPEGFIVASGMILGKTEETYEIREIPERVTVQRI